MPHADPEAVAAVEEDLALIASKGLKELRAFWTERWGCPPSLRSVALLRFMIAWRIQEAVYGGLDAHTLRLLRMKSIPGDRLPRGTTLTREYRGILHHVEVREHDYRYDGRDYANLSSVAEAITGTHWNGPRFFGLRDGSLEL